MQSFYQKMDIHSPYHSGMLTTKYQQAIISLGEFPKQLNKIKTNKALTEKTNFNDIYICHQTKYFPTYGVIKPRCYTFIDGIPGGTAQHAEIMRNVFAVSRSTVHFSVNSVLLSHDSNSFDNQDIVVIDHLMSVKDQIVGGYIEDLFCIGTFKLSSRSVILMPARLRTETYIMHGLASLPNTIKVISYEEGQKQQAVKDYLHSVKSDVCNIEYHPQDERYIGTMKNQYVSSITLLKAINGICCAHAATPMAQLEIMVYKQSASYGQVSKPPYLLVLSLLDLASIKNIVNQYIVVTTNCFKLNTKTTKKLHLYKSAVLEVFESLLISIQDPAPLKELAEDLKYYDAEPDFTTPIQNQLSIDLLRKC